MLTDKEILNKAKSTLELESESLLRAKSFLADDFVNAVKTVVNAKGRLIVTGIGKSANIAAKIVATLNSTGTPSVFMHAADAIHGDLGIIQKDDIVLCISNSGNTPEIKYLVPLIKDGGNPIIAFTGNQESFLWDESDFPIYSGVEREACPNNLAPTSSTTVQLALGDALAVTLLDLRGFKAKDFAKYHPGGALGKKLYLKVEDVISSGGNQVVGPTTSIKEVIIAISSNRQGAVAVVSKGELMGVITDGDVRRMLEKDVEISSLKASDIMMPSPKQIVQSEMATVAAEMIKSHNISQILVVDEDARFKGFVHFHDLLNEGIL